MSPTPALRVLIVDDDDVVREAFRMMFSRWDEFEIVGEAKNGEQAIDSYFQLTPDVTLMDLQMPKVSGIDAIAGICAKDPEAVVVALTTFGTHDHIAAALRAGAAGYLLKDAAGAELRSALIAARDGDMPLSAAVRRELVDQMTDGSAPTNDVAEFSLTPRELSLLECVTRGLSNQQISRELHLSEGSVKQYLSRLSLKMGVRSRTQLMIKAIQCHLVDPFSLEMTTS